MKIIKQDPVLNIAKVGQLIRSSGSSGIIYGRVAEITQCNNEGCKRKILRCPGVLYLLTSGQRRCGNSIPI